MDTACSNCQEKQNSSKRLPLQGVLGVILLGIIPKCPFCVLAYSSTAIMCGNGVAVQSSLVTHQSSLTIVITALTSILVLLGILLNWRDGRTYLSLTLAVMGILMVFYSVMQQGGLNLYYWGVVVVFIAIWVNGSFAWMLSFLKGRLKLRPNGLGQTN
jgi:hypothetical protein